ncbi:MAG: efflux RND transporter periplasmic adaptor subunit [Blastocatellia bacterium]|nr:efflux RND transporter periplasmic adaptor subunit [Blastocatellia bacterium]MBN8723018.1 efflux RND transporter periplasmic adaptor subunit [Acidobacteriota bacterium]
MSKTLILLLPLLLFTACQRSEPPAQANTSQASVLATAPTSISVTTSSAIERSLSSALELTGTLEGQEEVIVSSELDGKLSSMHIDLGSYVKKGDKLFSLDERELGWKLEQAKANLSIAEITLGQAGKPGESNDSHPAVRDAYAALEKAKIDFERTEQLLKDGVISRQEYDRNKSLYDQTRARWETAIAQVEGYRANLIQAHANLQLADKQLKDSIIYAPITASVKERLASTGQYVKKGEPLVKLIQINPLRLRTTVPEQYLQQLKSGETISFTVDSLPDKQFVGKITRFSPAVDKNSRSLMVEATIENPKLELKAGMFARVKLTFGEKRPVLLVPQKAVITAVGLNKIYVLADGKAQAREVTLGQKDGELIEIISGVSANETVITSNLDKLADGTVVNQQSN